MSTQGYFIVFWSIGVPLALIIYGAIAEGPLARGSLALGILGAIAWVCGALWIVNAMNTDI